MMVGTRNRSAGGILAWWGCRPGAMVGCQPGKFDDVPTARPRRVPHRASAGLNASTAVSPGRFNRCAGGICEGRTPAYHRAMMGDDQRDDVTSPAEQPRGAVFGPRFRPSQQGPQRDAPHYFPWGYVFLLNLVTCGLYASYWFVWRQRLFDDLRSTRKLGSLPSLSLGLACLNLAAAFLLGLVATSDPTAAPVGDLVSNLLSIASGIALLVLAFRTRRILLDHHQPVEPTYRLSGLGVFFFHAIYLQWAINQLEERYLRPASDDVAQVFE